MARTSPRKSASKQPAGSTATRILHCNRCPGRPVLSTCPVHSRKGRNKEQLASTEQSPPQQPELTSFDAFLDAGRTNQQPVLSPVRQGEPQFPSASQPAPHVSGAAWDQVLQALRNGPSQVDPIAFQQLLTSVVNTHEPQIADPALMAVNTPEPPIVDPTLTAGPPNTPVTSGSLGLQDPVSPSSPPSSRLGSPSLSTPSTPSSAKKRLRPTKANHPYGCVQGVLKGKVPFAVYRTAALKGRLRSRDKSTRTFNEGIGRVLNKVERLADATGAWIFITAQLPTASGGFINWTSPAMNKEVPKTHMDKMKTTTLRVYDALVNGRRQDCVDLQLQATEAKAQRDAMATQLRKEKDAVARAKALLHEQGIDVLSLFGQE
ncbi:hypothetical protein V5O48_014706 [Marasmius crinis-equi]|uniref:Uncharacterized protein n=1 Tax=Marasmius crinis-equi TaxID=585013 RepID=A0ABR3EWJ9_9AGAR